MGSFEWHLEQLGEHACCWVVDSDLCGLWCGHKGDHLPYVPGQYLLLPAELHPLDELQLRLARWPWPGVRCPFCRRRVEGWEAGPAVWTSWSVGDEERRVLETTWRFWPCGCMGWEVGR